MAVFIDLFKAFARVPYAHLIHKLKDNAFECKLQEFLKNFLSERSFSVKVSSALFSSSPVSSGVSHGSILSHHLSLIHANDLLEILSVPTLMYVDDVTIWSTNPTQLQPSINAAKRLSLDWDLPINYDKCAHMSFTTSACTFNILGGQQLPKTTQPKVLGFWISDNLSLSYHHQKACKAAFCVLNMLHRSFSIMGKEDFQFLLSTYIRPILEYGSQIAHSGLIRDRDCLERVQRRGTKLVKGFSDLPYSARLAELNMYPLESRRIRGDLMLLFHLFQTGDGHDFFTLTAQWHLREHDKKITLPHCRTHIRHNFFTLRIISTWNALPEEIVHSPSKTTFKRLLYF